MSKESYFKESYIKVNIPVILLPILSYTVQLYLRANKANNPNSSCVPTIRQLVEIHRWRSHSLTVVPKSPSTTWPSPSRWWSAVCKNFGAKGLSYEPSPSPTWPHPYTGQEEQATEATTLLQSNSASKQSRKKSHFSKLEEWQQQRCSNLKGGHQLHLEDQVQPDSKAESQRTLFGGGKVPILPARSKCSERIFCRQGKQKPAHILPTGKSSERA